MGRRSLFWQLIGAFLLISLTALVLSTWFTLREVQRFYMEQTRADLFARAHVIESNVLHALVPLDVEKLDKLCKDAGARGLTRVTVILPDGRVVGDSHENPAVMDNHRSRPEVKGALARDILVSTRFSHTLQQHMLYAAVPLEHDSKLVGVLRMALPLTTVRERLHDIFNAIVLAGVVVAVLATLTILILSRRITRPIVTMTRGAERFARGDLSTPIRVAGASEITRLAEAMNTMAREMGREIKRVRQQRSEQDVILASMTEGVLAIDTEERLIHLNNAAAELLHIDGKTMLNHTLQEAVRHPGLQDLVAGVMGGQSQGEGEIVLHHSHAERFAHAHVTGLQNADGQRLGALIVLHDITRLRQLENMRRDFVANVSHELKTPVTTIQGFIETLQDGALDDRKQAERFLGIMAKNANRLSAIINDLLCLSRMEQDRGRESLERQRTAIRTPLVTALDICMPKAEARQVSLALTCDDNLQVLINIRLMEQAFANLIDNAIKYSPEGATVRISATAVESEILISVADSGCGIAAEHLPRLFERFYRVDKGRSRDQGGTGLGLAIAKHIVQAHQGRIAVDSKVGQGSTFTITLPQG